MKMSIFLMVLILFATHPTRAQIFFLKTMNKRWIVLRHPRWCIRRHVKLSRNRRLIVLSIIILPRSLSDTRHWFMNFLFPFLVFLGMTHCYYRRSLVFYFLL